MASGSPYYTPPRSVVALREAYSMNILSQIASSEDSFLLLDPEPHIINRSNSVRRNYIASPWGWNHQIARLIREFAAAEQIEIFGIPSDEWLNNLRNLAHRRTTISFLNNLPQNFTSHLIYPREYSDLTEVIVRFQEDNRLFLKAPWSSSGRGVMRTDDLGIKHIEPWARGIIRSQGSVMIEPIYEKTLDFATEWWKDKNTGDVTFIGVSVFETSNRGKYHGQIYANQEALTNLICSNTKMFTQDLIEALRMAIMTTLEGYDGPVGIDMMVLSDGKIHPCVEMNLRKTMGMVAMGRIKDKG